MAMSDSKSHGMILWRWPVLFGIHGPLARRKFWSAPILKLAYARRQPVCLSVCMPASVHLLPGHLPALSFPEHPLGRTRELLSSPE